MYVVAIYGPYGAPIKTFVKELREMANQAGKTVVNIAEETFATSAPYQPNHKALIAAMDVAQADLVIVSGHLLFTDGELNEVLRRKCDACVFREVDCDTAVINLIREFPEQYMQVMDEYEQVMKGLNDRKINPSKRFAEVTIQPKQTNIERTCKLLLVPVVSVSLGNEADSADDDRAQRSSSFFGAARS